MTATRMRRRPKATDKHSATAPGNRFTSTVSRVGFDHGWLCLSPTFLNFQRPVLLVDHRLLPDPASLGLQPFGSRNPRQPLPTTQIVVQCHPGARISIWDHQTSDPTSRLLGWHHAYDSQHASWAHVAGSATVAVVIIGDTYRIQLCWAALWDGHIGHAHLISAGA